MIILTLLKKAAPAVLVLGVTAAATWVATGPSLAIALAEPRAWIDEPLGGATFPPGEEIVVIAHATDPDGIELVILRVDGAQVEAKTGGGLPLVTVEFAWTPPGEGDYELEVVGRDSGSVGKPGQATITVGTPDPPEDPTSTTTSTTTATTEPGDPEETTTTAATVTSEPGATVPPVTSPPGTAPPGTTPPTTPPTAPPCQAPAPTPTSPADGASTPFRQPELSWTYSGCPVGGFRVEVSRRDSFGDVVASSPTLGPSVRTWRVTPQLACGGPYYWRVRWVDGRALGPWSTVRSFTVVAREC